MLESLWTACKQISLHKQTESCAELYWSPKQQTNDASCTTACLSTGADISFIDVKVILGQVEIQIGLIHNLLQSFV